MVLPESNNKVVLITGVNGYIASRTAEAFLNAGFSIRGTARSKDSSANLQMALDIFVQAGRFEVVEVKDIIVPGAFDEVVKGCFAIAHMASPVSLSFDDPEPVIRTAVQGTKSVLESALKSGGSTLKSVVQMSSIGAITGNKAPPYTYTEEDWNDISEDIAEKLGKKTPGAHIYLASKTASEKAFWKFHDEKTPSFSMTAINPVFVVGPPLTFPDDPSKLPETVINVYTILSGQPIPPPLGGSGGFVDIRDVAALMVYGVEHHETANGERFIASGGVGAPQAIADILNAKYPDRNIAVGAPGEGYEPGWGFKDGGILIESSKAQKALGRNWTTYDKTILDAAKSFERYL